MSLFEQTMIGLSPQCYIPNLMTISLLVPEKNIFEGFLSYMGMAAILVMCPVPREKPFVPPSHGCSTWYLTSIGPLVSEEMFENVDRLQTTTTEAGHIISSSVSLRLRWANNKPCRPWSDCSGAVWSGSALLAYAILSATLMYKILGHLP